MWDTTWNFGYKRLSNGTCEVFHSGEYFYGPFPVRIGMYLHWQLIGYLVQKHVNSPAFGSGKMHYAMQIQMLRCAALCSALLCGAVRCHR